MKTLILAVLIATSTSAQDFRWSLEFSNLCDVSMGICEIDRASSKIIKEITIETRFQTDLEFITATNWTGQIFQDRELGYIVTNHVLTVEYQGTTKQFTLKTDAGNMAAWRPRHDLKQDWYLTNSFPIFITPCCVTNWIITNWIINCNDSAQITNLPSHF